MPAAAATLRLVPGSLDGTALLREMGTGLLVVELQGHGVELASGQWSKGVKGFWVEGGVIQHPCRA